MQDTHLISQGGLVTHSGRHTSEQGGHLGTCLGETEDVVDEQQHVLVLNIAEVLRHGQARQSHTHTDSWRLVHLAKDQCGVLKNTHFFHLKEQVRTLTGTFAHTGKHRGTGEFAGDTGDHFLDQHRLAHTSATEQADLSTLHVWGEQVDDLNTGF